MGGKRADHIPKAGPFCAALVLHHWLRILGHCVAINVCRNFTLLWKNRRRQLNIWKEELFQLTAQTCLRKERMLNPPRTNFPVWLVERRHQSGDRSHLYLNAFERNPVFVWKIDHFSVPNHPLRFIQIRLKAVWEKWIQAVLADLLMGIFVLCFPERVHICLFISQDVWMMYFSIMSVCGLVCMDFRVLNVCIILEQISICHWHRGKGSQCLVIKRARGCFLFFNRESLFFFQISIHMYVKQA